MPNWVKTIIKTDSEVIKDILKKYKQDNNLSFDKIIPMPKDLDVEYSSMGEQGLIYLFIKNTDEKIKSKIESAYKELNGFDGSIKNSIYFNDIKKEFNKFSQDKKFKDSIKLGEKYLDNFLKYGYCNWYNWRCKNWGTKWNNDSLEYSNDSLILYTAWSCPTPIIKELSHRYPSFLFQISFADELIKENSGFLEIKNQKCLYYERELTEENIKNIWELNLNKDEYEEEEEMEK